MTLIQNRPTGMLGSREDPAIHGLNVYVMTITPTIAAEWLQMNTMNRPPKASTSIPKFARDMLAGNWPLNGQTIIRAIDGTLLDGQNRCMACVESGIPFTTLVVEGVDQDAFVTIDRGTARTPGDMLTILGVENATAVAAAATYVWRYQNGKPLKAGGPNSPTVDELLRVVTCNPDIADSVTIGKRPNNPLRPPAAASFTHWLLSQKDAALATEFFDRLTIGDQLPADSPILQLKHLLDKANRGQARQHVLPARSRIGVTVKAWNLWRSGKTTRLLSFKSTEAVPEPI